MCQKNLCHFRLRFIWCRCWSNISLNCRFHSLRKILHFYKIEQERKLIYQGREHLLSKISHHSSVSLGYTDWLLFLRCNNGCMNRWKSGYTKLVSLKPWSQQNPILFLNIQTSSEIVWFEMLRANHRTLRRLPFCTFRLHEIDLWHSPFLRFRTIIAIKRYGMKCNTFLYVSCVATSPYNAPSWFVFELHSQPFPQTQVIVRNTESSCPVDPRSRTKLAAFWRTLTSHGKSRI